MVLFKPGQFSKTAFLVHKDSLLKRAESQANLAKDEGKETGCLTDLRHKKNL